MNSKRRILFYLIIILGFIINFIFIYTLKTKKKNVDYFSQRKYLGNLSKYIELHDSIINKSDNEIKRITFVIDCKLGYGNVIYDLLTGIVIAIITDTAIKVEWPVIEKYIESPLKNILKTYDQDSQLNSNFRNGTYNYEVLLETPNEWAYGKKVDFLLNTTIPLYKNRYVHRNFRALFFPLCANRLYYRKFLEYDLVNKKTIENAREAFIKNDLNEFDRIETLYKVGFEVGSNILNKVWLLKQHIINDINQIYFKNFRNNFVIGIQFRFHYIDDKDVINFVECANYIKEINNVSNVKWFITSDNEKIFKLLENYEDIIIQGKGQIGHVSENPSSYNRTLIDMELLSRCDEMIITGGSTFGFTSAMMKQVLPYYIEGRRQKDIGTDKPCKRMTFNKPPRTPLGFGLI